MWKKELKAIRKKLMAESGKSNSSWVHVREDGSVTEHYNTICYGQMRNADGKQYDCDKQEYIAPKPTKYIITNIKNILTGDDMYTREGSPDEYKNIARRIWALPFVKKVFLNTSFNDAWNNGAVFKVPDREWHITELVLPLTMFREPMEYDYYSDVFNMLRKRGWLVKHAVLAAFYMRIVRDNVLWREGTGHSVVASWETDYKYFLGVVKHYAITINPKAQFERGNGKPLNCQAFTVNATMGNKTGDKNLTKLPFKEIGNGWNKQTVVDLEQVEKDLKNA